MQKDIIDEKKNKKISNILFIILMFLTYLNIFLFYQVYEGFWKVEDLNVASYETPINSTFYAMSENIKWQNSSKLNIFANPSYNNASIILPEVNGKYVFSVNNINKVPIKYFINFESENRKNINIKYKLKLNENYIIGDNNWVGIEELKYELGYLKPNSEDILTLEWIWVEGENDNKYAGAKYTLFINISAELQKRDKNDR